MSKDETPPPPPTRDERFASDTRVIDGDRSEDTRANRTSVLGGFTAAEADTASRPRLVDEADTRQPAWTGPRRVRLSLARLDPWSVMKLSFLLSVAVGIMIVVAAAVIWQTLNEMAVFTQINDIIATLAGTTDYFDVLEYAAFPRVISLATMIAVVDVVLLTALSTIMAFLYNIVAALVGGLHLTLTDD